MVKKLMYVQHKKFSPRTHGDEAFKIRKIENSQAIFDTHGTFWFLDNCIPSTKPLHKIWNFFISAVF